MAKEDSPANGHNNYRVPVDKHLAVPINSGNHVPSSLSTGRISGNSFPGGSSLSAARQTVARMPENTNIESTTPCLRLQALLTERPKSPMARVRCAWTDIASALSAGHSLKVIHQRLYEDGLEISYRSLARHVNRFRMEQGKKLPRVAMRINNSEGRVPAGQTAATGDRVDPLASAIEALSSGRYSVREAMCDGDPTQKKLI